MTPSFRLRDVFSRAFMIYVRTTYLVLSAVVAGLPIGLPLRSLHLHQDTRRTGALMI